MDINNLLDFIDTTFAYAAQKANTLELTIGEKLHAALQLNHTHRKIRGGDFRRQPHGRRYGVSGLLSYGTFSVRVS